MGEFAIYQVFAQLRPILAAYQNFSCFSQHLLKMCQISCFCKSQALQHAKGMEMDSYESRILDGVLVQKQNRTSRCLKSHASVSQIFGTKRTNHIRYLSISEFAIYRVFAQLRPILAAYQNFLHFSWHLLKMCQISCICKSWALQHAKGMEMDSYKSWISDGVLVQKRNRMSRCLKSHASVSQFFGTKCTHSRIPGLKGEALFLTLFSFFGVSADRRLVQFCIIICKIQIHTC